MFDAHPPFQIDGNFGGARAIAEMLMQSDGDMIRLLPALPAAWGFGRVAGLRARGGCRVDLSWAAGWLEAVTLTVTHAGERDVVLAGRTCRVRLAAGRPLTLTGAELRAG